MFCAYTRYREYHYVENRHMPDTTNTHTQESYRQNFVVYFGIIFHVHIKYRVVAAYNHIHLTSLINHFFYAQKHVWKEVCA